jgi:hypothetical protein
MSRRAMSLLGCYYYVPSVELGGTPVTTGGTTQMQYAAATGPIVVFGVEYSGTTANPTENPIKPGQGMMGVGFGRPTLGCVVGATVYQVSNPFMSVVTSAGQAYYQSYELTASDANGSAFVTIGMTSPAFTAAYEGAALVKLTAGTPVTPTNVKNYCGCSAGTAPPTVPPAPPCWNSAPVYFSVAYGNSSTPVATATGTMLLDTGVDLMMMSMVYDAATATTGGWSENLGGATITINAPGEAGAVVNYNFQLASTSIVVQQATVWPVAQSPTPPVEAPTTFQAVNINANPGSNFVNTGINVIQGYNYLYDGQAGYVGFAPVKKS